MEDLGEPRKNRAKDEHFRGHPGRQEITERARHGPMPANKTSTVTIDEAHSFYRFETHISLGEKTHDEIYKEAYKIIRNWITGHPVVRKKEASPPLLLRGEALEKRGHFIH